MRRWKKAVLCMLCISALGQMAACTTSKNDGMLDKAEDKVEKNVTGDTNMDGIPDDTTTMDGKTNGQ
ncbi:MAG: hypothetical protein RR369_04170 [Lachnospiraceae bacterium]